MSRLHQGVRIALLLCLTGAAMASDLEPSPTEFQSLSSGIQAYYQVPATEFVRIRREFPEEECPVIFELAQQAEVNPEIVARLRRSGMSWMDISERLAIPPQWYYIPVELTESSGPYWHSYRHFRRWPQTQWSRIRFSDDDIISLINLRFVVGYYRYQPEQVVSWRSQGRHFSWIYRQPLSWSHRSSWQEERPTTWYRTQTWQAPRWQGPHRQPESWRESSGWQRQEDRDWQPLDRSNGRRQFMDRAWHEQRQQNWSERGNERQQADGDRWQRQQSDRNWSERGNERQQADGDRWQRQQTDRNWSERGNERQQADGDRWQRQQTDRNWSERGNERQQADGDRWQRQELERQQAEQNRQQNEQHRQDRPQRTDYGRFQQTATPEVRSENLNSFRHGDAAVWQRSEQSQSQAQPESQQSHGGRRERVAPQESQSEPVQSTERHQLR